MFHSVDETRLEHIDLARSFDIGEAGEELSEHHTDLPTSEVCTETEVRPRTAESEMTVGLAPYVEPKRIGKQGLVAVRSEIEHRELVAGGDLDTAE
jgi:hypothetical protein